MMVRFGWIDLVFSILWLVAQVAELGTYACGVQTTKVRSCLREDE
jgi:hypothetical protein